METADTRMPPRNKGKGSSQNQERIVAPRPAQNREEMMKNNDPKITVDRIVYAEKPAQYKAVAEPAGDGDAYRN